MNGPLIGYFPRRGAWLATLNPPGSGALFNLKAQGARGALIAPGAPMGRVDIEPLRRGAVRPAAGDTPARKHQRMRAVVIDNRQFEIAAKRCIRDDFPHRTTFGRFPTARIEVDHSFAAFAELTWIKCAPRYSRKI